MAKAKTTKRKKSDPFNGAPLTPGNPGNSGGKKGRSGRPPDEFKEFMRGLVSSADAKKRLKQILKGESVADKDGVLLVDGKLFLDAYKFATERGHGKVPTVIEGGDERKPLTIRLVRERSS